MYQDIVYVCMYIYRGGYLMNMCNINIHMRTHICMHICVCINTHVYAYIVYVYMYILYIHTEVTIMPAILYVKQETK